MYALPAGVESGELKSFLAAVADAAAGEKLARALLSSHSNPSGPTFSRNTDFTVLAKSNTSRKQWQRS
jgi:hypothetical protein